MEDIFIEIDDKIVTIETSPLKNKGRYMNVLSASKKLLQDVESQFPQTTIAKSKAKLSFLHNFPKNHTLLYDVLIKPVDNLTSVIDQLPTSEPVEPETPNAPVEPATAKKSKKEKPIYTIEMEGIVHTTTNRDLYLLLKAQGKEATIQKNKKSRKQRK